MLKKVLNYGIYRLKTVFNNYNIKEKAEIVLKIEKRAAPRHPGTDVKFQVLVKGNPDIRERIEKRDEALLNRLKIVKVNSKDSDETDQVPKRPLPFERGPVGLPEFGYNEPSVVPEGKCTLRQALEFIAKHQNDPGNNSVETIAKDYSLEPGDVKNIIDHFRAFEIYIGRDVKEGVSPDVLEKLGVGKIVKPVYRQKFAHLEKNVIGGFPREQEKNIGGQEKNIGGVVTTQEKKNTSVVLMEQVKNAVDAEIVQNGAETAQEKKTNIAETEQANASKGV